MKNRIGELNWRAGMVVANGHCDSLGDDFILTDRPVIEPPVNTPFKIDMTSAMVSLKGTTRGKINLTPYVTEGQCMVVHLRDQILEYEYISDDFEGLFIIMSSRFLESLNIQERLSAFLTVRDNPVVPLNDQALDAMKTYFEMMRTTIRMEDNPHRMEIARNLTRAFFYGAGYYFHKTADDRIRTKREVLVDDFMRLVEANYREHRGLEFYAGKLFLTPKYMSSLIKEQTGRSAGEWIDNYVVQEAKALLKSTGMTIQQISNELNFPSQSFFGKHFKRLTGISPKEYRKD